MNKRIWIPATLTLVFCLIVATVILAAPDGETEPNDTPGTANQLLNRGAAGGSISPVGDQDYYSISGVNTTWGFIALLETVTSTTSTNGVLTALGSDGTTVLQTDSGSWERGSGIALQNYANGSATHYLLVNEAGDNAEITPYTLRYYETIVITQSEVEPNETRLQGTPSSFTNAGTLNPGGDVDCFAFEGWSGDSILLALDGDPESDGSPVNPVLTLVSSTGSVLKTADFTGNGGNEFLEYEGLPDTGVYAFCVSSSAGNGSPDGSYHVGIVRNGGLYNSSYDQRPTRVDPRPGFPVVVGDTLTFRLAITNTSPVALPGGVDLGADYPTSCTTLVGTNPAPTATGDGTVDWDNLKIGLDPGEVYSVTLTLRADSACQEILHQLTRIDYFFTGAGNTAVIEIYSDQVFLPVVEN